MSARNGCVCVRVVIFISLPGVEQIHHEYAHNGKGQSVGLLLGVQGGGSSRWMVTACRGHSESTSSRTAVSEPQCG